jgi:hypothetical protein
MTVRDESLEYVSYIMNAIMTPIFLNGIEALF